MSSVSIALIRSKNLFTVNAMREKKPHLHSKISSKKSFQSILIFKTFLVVIKEMKKVTECKRMPSQRTPTQRTPIQRTPTQRTPTQRSATQYTPTQRMPTQRTPTQRMPTQRTPTQRLLSIQYVELNIAGFHVVARSVVKD